MESPPSEVEPVQQEPEQRPVVADRSVEDIARNWHIMGSGSMEQSTRPEEGRLRFTITDDDIGIANAMRWMLEAGDPGVKFVGHAKHGAAGVALAGDIKPDVALMDIHMDGIDAFRAAQEIREQAEKSGHDIRVLFWTGFPKDIYLDRCIQADGANAAGMLSKHTAPPEEIVTAMKYVHKNKDERYFSPELATRLAEHDSAGDSGINDRVSKLANLTERELIVLKQLSTGKTNREIADSLDLGLRSIEKAVSDLKKALDIPTTNELLIFAANEGIVYPEISQVPHEEEHSVVSASSQVGANRSTPGGNGEQPVLAESAAPAETAPMSMSGV